MKKFYILAVMSFMTMACQKNIIQKEAVGRLSLLLENSPIVEVLTKAEGGQVSVDDFNVYVSSEDAVYTYVYRDMPSVITVPAGYYAVSAENVTETESLNSPDIWGQVRYAGASEQKEVAAGLNPTQYSITCTMVNTAVSVVFGENIDKHFTDYAITLFTDPERKLEYTPSNTTGEAPAVGYFCSGVQLSYVFTGTYIIGNEPVVIRGSKLLQPATHLHLTFRMSQQNGAVGKPEIIVDYACEDLYETITVDPSEGGSFEYN